MSSAIAGDVKVTAEGHLVASCDDPTISIRVSQNYIVDVSRKNKLIELINNEAPGVLCNNNEANRIVSTPSALEELVDKLDSEGGPIDVWYDDSTLFILVPESPAKLFVYSEAEQVEAPLLYAEQPYSQMTEARWSKATGVGRLYAFGKKGDLVRTNADRLILVFAAGRPFKVEESPSETVSLPAWYYEDGRFPDALKTEELAAIAVLSLGARQTGTGVYPPASGAILPQDPLILLEEAP